METFSPSLFKRPFMSLQVKVFFSCLVWLLFTHLCLAQQDDADIDWYRSFFQNNFEQSTEELMTAARSRLTEAEQQKDAAAQARAMTGIALLNLTQVNDYEQALGWFIKSLALEDSLKLPREQIFTYMGMANVFEQVGDYQRSASFLEHARQINSTINSNPLSALILSESGRVKSRLGKTDEAFADYEMLMEYADELRRSDLKADALFSMGELLRTQGEYPRALETHKKALNIRRSMKDDPREAVSLNAIGELYRLMKNIDRALANHVAAINIRSRLKDKPGLAESYNNAGKLYYEQKNYKQAVANLNLALAAAEELSLQEAMRTTYDYLSLCHKALKDYKKALEYRELFQAMHELIESDKDARRLVEAQNLYVIRQKESEINQLESVQTQREQQLAAQVKLRNFLFLIIGLGIIVVALILYLYLLNQRANNRLKAANAQVGHQNEKLQELNATKDKFFSIIGHDLKGPLNSLTSFSGLLMNHTDSLSKEEIQMVAKDLDKSLKNLFALLENLLEWSRAQTGGIEFTPEPFDLTALIEDNKTLLKNQAQQKNITLVSQQTQPLAVNAHKHSINTVVRNLVSNAIKFTPAGGTVTIDAQPGKGEVLVTVADTGVGIPKEVQQKLFRLDTKHSTKGTADEKGTGLGLILCKEFVERNGGSIGVSSEEGKGSTFYFTIPVFQ